MGEENTDRKVSLSQQHVAGHNRKLARTRYARQTAAIVHRHERQNTVVDKQLRIAKSQLLSQQQQSRGRVRVEQLPGRPGRRYISAGQIVRTAVRLLLHRYY